MPVISRKGLCDGRLWKIVKDQACPVCGAPAVNALCRAAYDKPAFEAWKEGRCPALIGLLTRAVKK